MPLGEDKLHYFKHNPLLASTIISHCEQAAFEKFTCVSVWNAEGIFPIETMIQNGGSTPRPAHRNKTKGNPKTTKAPTFDPEHGSAVGANGIMKPS